MFRKIQLWAYLGYSKAGCSDTILFNEKKFAIKSGTAVHFEFLTGR